MIIGIMGKIGAGKGAVSDILREKGYDIVTIGDLVREETVSEGLELNRGNTDRISKSRTASNPNYWREKAYEKVKELERAVIDGIRYPEDAEFFKEKLGKNFRLIFVTAPTLLRFERMKSRNRPGDPKSIEEFEHQDLMQERLFNVSKTLQMSDYEIDNSGSMESLKKKVEKFLDST